MLQKFIINGYIFLLKAFRAPRINPVEIYGWPTYGLPRIASKSIPGMYPRSHISLE